MMKLSHEVLLALTYVSQISDPDSVRSRFIEFLNGLDENFAFEFIDYLPPGIPEYRIMPIATLRSSFGYAVMAESAETSEADRAVFRNAFKFLATLLENRIQERALASKNESLLKEINQEKSLIRTVLDTLPVGVWVADGKGTILMVNHAGKKIWGGISYVGIDQYSEYKAWWSNTGKRIKSEEWAVARAIKTGETSIDEEIDIECFDGTHKTILNSAAPFLDDERKVIGAVGINQDITERKQAEIKIRESEERFRAIFERSTVGKSLTAPDGKLLRINKAFADMLGYTIEELQEINFAQITYPDDVAEGRECIRILLSGEQAVYRMEKRYIHKRGHIVWTNVSSTLLRDNKGTPIYFITSILDITERKRREEEILKADKLESVGVLAGGIAHDFNNILTSISGNISMAKMQAKPGHKIFDLLSAAETASVRAQGLTRQLLTFAKGGVPIKETASIQKLIKDSALFVLQGSKSGCEFQIAKDLWPVEADTGQISQVISNIVINANQAMPEGGIIQVAAENLVLEESQGLLLKPGRYIRISIKDQGVGIAEQHLSKIFDPYFTTKQAGSGLGLASVYSIIKKHNGHISVDSIIGVGTTFHIYLPVSDKEVPVKEEAVLLTGCGKILMMDDDELLKELAKEMLDMLGYESAFAKNGAEAIEMYRKAMESGKPYDAVILDMTIPGGMGGEEVIKILLSIDPEVKTIVFSGYAEGEVMSNYREYGFKGMMPKPFDSYALGKVLNDVLKDN